MDITERKQGETVLRESEEKYRLLMETVPDAIIISGFDDDRLLHVNESFSRITGYKLSSFIPEDYSTVIINKIDTV